VAKDLCNLGAKWEIEEFVRIKIGFEIIFCEFNYRLVLEGAYERLSRKNQSFERVPQLDMLRGESIRYLGITAQII
jgi:hypothetical protein